MLNTRTSRAAETLDQRPRSTIDYGLPDLSRFWPACNDSEQELARLIERSIMAFEPRLRAPQVVISRIPGRGLALQATVTGSIALDAMIEPVTFPILVDERTDD